MTIYSLFCYHSVDAKEDNSWIDMRDSQMVYIKRSAPDRANLALNRTVNCWATTFNYGCQDGYRAGFINLCTTDILGQIFVGRFGLFCTPQDFRSIPGLYLLDASSPPPFSLPLCVNQKYLRIVRCVLGNKISCWEPLA